MRIVPNDQTHRVFASVLRYCPTCIKQGFHSALFQLRWVTACPLHHEDLQDHCPQCGAAIPYELTHHALQAIYGCPACGYKLASQVVLLSPQEDRGRNDRLQEVSRWLTTLGEVQAGVAYEDWSLRHADVDRRLRRLPYYWASAHCGGPQPEWLAQPREVVHVSMHLSGTAKTMPYLADDEYPEGLSTQAKAVFSSVARYLRRRLRGHARCIEFVRHEIWWQPWENTGPVCQWAYTYLMWRMFWERLESPSAVHQKLRRYRRSDRNQLDSTTASSLVRVLIAMQVAPESAALRLFGLALLDTWETLVAWGDECANSGSFSWNRDIAAYVPGSYLLLMKERNGAATLHWWRHPKRTPMFTNEPCGEACRHLMQAMRDDLHTRWQRVVDAAEHLAAENNG